MKKTGAKLTRKAAVCLLAVPMIVGLSGCAQKSTDTTSTKQAKEAQATPTSTPFQYYASVDDEPRTISGQCRMVVQYRYESIDN